MAGVEPADAQDEARHERCQRSPSHGAPLLLESQDGRVRLVIWVQELRQELEETQRTTQEVHDLHEIAEQLNVLLPHLFRGTHEWCR